MRRPLLRAGLALVAASGLLFGLLRLGHWARDRLDQRNHYTVAFAEIHCPVPPGMAPADFLAEVQYLGTLPDQVNVLEARLAARLAAAFALHPWVERVDGVALRGPGGPQVRLRLRTPALAVAGRVLDGRGVLLPADASAAGLVRLPGDGPPPQGPAGAPWGDPDVEGVARTAALLQPFQGCLGLTEVEITPEGLEFRGGVRLRWGRPVGAESEGEPATDAKLARLRSYCDQPGGREGPGGMPEIDLRRPE